MSFLLLRCSPAELLGREVVFLAEEELGTLLNFVEEIVMLRT